MKWDSVCTKSLLLSISIEHKEDNAITTEWIKEEFIEYTPALHLVI